MVWEYVPKLIAVGSQLQFTMAHGWLSYCVGVKRHRAICCRYYETDEITP